MRKYLSKIIVCLLLCVFSATMFACGKKPEKVDAYEGLTQFIEKVEQDNKTNGMFTASLVNGVASDYVLTEYLNDGTYGYYNQSMIIPMNFIKNYYQDLERIRDNAYRRCRRVADCPVQIKAKGILTILTIESAMKNLYYQIEEEKQYVGEDSRNP